MTKSRTKAQELIKDGKVKVDGKKIKKKSKKVPKNAEIELEEKYPYVSKGGFKLDKALRKFNIDFKNKKVADIGSSTGGFTDRILKDKAEKVYAIEKSEEPILDEKIRKKEKVKEMRGQDIRELEKLPEKVDSCTIDVTFTSLREVLPKTRELMKKEGDIIAVLKPPFEGKERKKEEVRNLSKEERKKRIKRVEKWCKENGFKIEGIVSAPDKGKKRSKEYMLYLKRKE